MVRGAVKGVLRAFLGTYTSRNADYQGYWLFGFIVGDLTRLEIDLLGPVHPAGEPSSPLDAAEQLARAKFQDQLAKAKVTSSHLSEATLAIERLSPRSAIAGFRQRAGFDIRFLATATMSRGQQVALDEAVFVAPHDPALERRRKEV